MDEQTYEYRTGSTRPRKRRSGLVATVLMGVILLFGIISTLRLVNIRLTLPDSQPDRPPLSFAQGDIISVTPEGDVLTVSGITVQELPPLYRQMYQLPAGLYVVDAPKDSPVAPGDVLVAFDGAAVTTLDTLKTAYSNKHTGDTLWFTFHREGTAFSYTIPFEN